MDSQIHLTSPDSAERPWVKEWASVGRRSRQMGAEEILSEMDSAGVDKAVLVPPGWEGDRNDTALDAAAAHPDRFGVMGRLDLTSPDPRTLDTWLDQPGMLGARVTFSLGEQALWLTDGTADWLWPAAENAGVPLMVYPPSQVLEMGRIANEHPHLTIVIDHLGLSLSETRSNIKRALESGVFQLADLPNVAVKASGLQGHATAPYPYRDLHDTVREVVARFGPRRVFWGSDLTMHSSSYFEARSWIEEALDQLSSDDLSWIMGRGIVDWLRWRVR